MVRRLGLLYLAETTEYTTKHQQSATRADTGTRVTRGCSVGQNCRVTVSWRPGAGTRRHVQIPRCGQEGASPAECCHRCLLCLALLIVATTAAVPGPRTVCAAHAHSRQLHLRLRNSSAARPGRRSCSGCRGWTVARPTRNSVLAAVRLYSGPSSQ